MIHITPDQYAYWRKHERTAAPSTAIAIRELIETVDTLTTERGQLLSQRLAAEDQRDKLKQDLRTATHTHAAQQRNIIRLEAELARANTAAVAAYDGNALIQQLNHRLSVHETVVYRLRELLSDGKNLAHGAGTRTEATRTVLSEVEKILVEAAL